MPNFLVNNNFYQGTSSACIVELNPPIFSGIANVDVESRGQIRAGWSAATDATAPIRYEIYVKASTNVGLFATANIIALTDKLQFDIFNLPDGSFLQNGTTYFVGVRAIDGVSNRDSNTVSLSVISTGVLTSIDVYETKASFTNISNNQFKVVAWANKNESLAISPSAVMGTATFNVYDSSGNIVAGFSGTQTTPSAQGMYVFSPISGTLDAAQAYQLRTSIFVDGEARVNFTQIPKQEETYVVDGVVSLDNTNNIIGSFWIENNGQVLTSGLGTASYQVYLANGTLVPGLTQSGITADLNGFFTITPFALPGTFDVTESYIARITLQADGQTKVKNLVIEDEPVVYEPRAVFSINASNQLEATFWCTRNNELVTPSLLGTASYVVYDKLGTAVVGVTQTGITSDSNGKFHTAPVSAALLTDLTHYTAIINISVAGKIRTSAKGFTLLGN